MSMPNLNGVCRGTVTHEGVRWFSESSSLKLRRYLGGSGRIIPPYLPPSIVEAATVDEKRNALLKGRIREDIA
jgi:hypothetical protein